MIGYLPGTIIPALLTLISLKIFSVYLTIDEFGLYNYWFTLALLISSVFSQWISQPILRYGTDLSIKYQEQVTSWFVSLIGMILGIFLILENLFIGEDVKLYSLITVLIFLFTCLQIIYAKLQINFESGKYSILRFAESISKGIIPLIGIYLFEPKVEVIFFSIIIGISLILAFQYKKIFPSNIFGVLLIKEKTFLKTRKIYYSFGLPMVIWFLINAIMSFTDRFLLKTFSGYDSVAIYSANYTLITGSVVLVTAPLLMIAHPLLMKYWNASLKNETGKLLTNFTEIFIIFSFSLVVLTFLNRDTITMIFLDEKFKEGNVVMPLILIGFIIWQLGMFLHKPLEFEGDTKKMVIAMMAACSINIVLNLLLIPKLSYIGASISSIISYISYSIIVFRWGNKIIHYNLINSSVFIKNFLLSIVLLLPTIAINQLDFQFNTIFFNIILSLIYFIIYLKINLKRLFILFRIIK